MTVEWKWQNTFTSPGVVKRLARDSPFGYRPRSNVAPFDSENTLWKITSSFGNSTIDPAVTAMTRG